MSEWFVYIILTEKDRLYTGITTHLERRFNEHLSDKLKGAKFFRSDRPIVILLIEQYLNRSEASVREAAIKKMTKMQKEKLIFEFANKRA